jgi:hypothetical protein
VLSEDVSIKSVLASPFSLKIFKHPAEEARTSKMSG